MSQNGENGQENEKHQSSPAEETETLLPKSEEAKSTTDIVEKSEGGEELSCKVNSHTKISPENDTATPHAHKTSNVTCSPERDNAMTHAHKSSNGTCSLDPSGNHSKTDHSQPTSRLDITKPIAKDKPDTEHDVCLDSLPTGHLKAIESTNQTVPLPAHSPQLKTKGRNEKESARNSLCNLTEQGDSHERGRVGHIDPAQEPLLNSVMTSDDSLISKNAEEGQKTRTHLGSLRPIYRLSMKLPQNIFNNIEIPNVDKHRHIDKAGYLQKLCGRNFPYLHQWRRRYCVLTRGKLFFYEKEDSKGSDKASGLIDLKYFDHVVEASPKDAKKATNVFIITSQDRSFFDPGRYLLSADTLTEMNEWIQRLRDSLQLIKNNNRPPRKEERKETPAKENMKSSAASPGQSHPKKKDASGQSAEDVLDGKKPKSEKQGVAFDQRKMDIHARLAASYASSSSQTDSPGKSQKREEAIKVKLNEEPPSSGPKAEGQQPCSALEQSKPLESITKHRPKGPVGRRAPHTRRTALMKQRASSMSALQQGNQADDALRPKNWEAGSTELLEEPRKDPEKAAVNTSHPALAYRYSSDEDSDGEPDILLDAEGYLGMSASALNQRPPSPPPRTCSFNVDDPGLPSAPAEGTSSRRSSAVLAYHCDRPEELLDYRSLPRSHGGRISSGRSSPAMDALENHLMNQSIQHLAGPEENLSDPESSDVSTFKGTHQQHQQPQQCPSSIENLGEVSNALISLSSALQHTQQHTAALDARTKSLEKDLNAMAGLPSSAEHLRKELEQLAESVAFVSQEASRARIDLMSQRQETERIHQEATMALSDAEKTRQELQKTRKEYESLIKELHALITSIKTTLEVSDPPESIPKTQAKLSDKKLTPPEHVPTKDKQKNDKGKEKKDPEPKKIEIPKESNPKIVGYQSFFQRPSSLIYGLTSRSIGKAVSFGEKDKKNREKQGNNNLETEEKKSKSKNNSLDKKQKVDKQVGTSEKKAKATRKPTESEPSKKETPSQSKSTNTDMLAEERPKKLERSPARLSIDDLPMMDDHSNEAPSDKGNVAFGISHVSINVSPPILTSPRKLSLEKSPSSPVIPDRSSFSNRPSYLNIPVSSDKETNKSPSSSPSPESARKKSLSRRMEQRVGKSTSKEDIKRSSEAVSESRHSNTSARTHSPRISGSENRTTSISSRPGVFAISRQSSSPNLPLQRQSSSTVFPIQRQLSLGTVPEEGLLPRQASLMSVPEDRPIVDQTLPLSPTSSLISFPLSPSPSTGGGLNVRNSMELVTGAVISGSSFQEASSRQIPPASEFHGAEIPLMTSSLKKENEKKKRTKLVVV